MGAIFFYIFVYFIGYYGSNILNMLTVRPFITNRYMAALLPVYGVALTHAYVLVVVVTLGAAYFMWNSKGKDDDHTGDNPSDNDRNSAETATVEAADLKTEEQSGNTESSDEKVAPRRSGNQQE